MNQTQWEKRVRVVQIIYSYLITEVKDDTNFLKFCLNEYKIDLFQLKIIEVFIKNKAKIIELIERNSINKNWSFIQLNFVVRAILIEAISEKIAHKTDKAILIDQSIITTKKFCDESNTDYVNALLDKVL